MTGIELKGITWAHRRAVDPLTATLPAFAARRHNITISWSSRTLHGFEFAPIEELAALYDLVILDHPFCGDIAATECLLPLDALFDERLARAFVGPSLESYRYAGHIWALPVDAACQVAVARPDLMARLDRASPRTWDEVLALGAAAQRHGMRLAIGLRGVHSLMTFFTLCANLGRPCGTRPEEPLADRTTALEALEAMRALLAYCPKDVLNWNSIALHDVLAERDDLVFCPAVYCYATYAEADQANPLRFFDLPGLDGATPRGSTIGGTGIGISARTADPEAALAYVGFLAEAETQRAFAMNHGQPARRDVWEADEIDARFGGCYSATRATMESAWIRPRYTGYLDFQAKAGALLEGHLRGDVSEDVLLERLEALHRAGGGQADR